MAHVHGNRGDRTRRLVWVLALTAVYTVAELVGGLISNSLALLADAGHMLGDVMAIGLALGAAWVARRPPDAARTFGYQRAEILAALLNGVALIVIAVFVALEALERFRDPPAIEWVPMLGIGIGGLIVNVVAVRLLHAGQGNLNIRGAYLHVLGDLIGSFGVILAAFATGLGGAAWADPLASSVLSVIIVVGAIRLVLQSLQVLMEGAPPGIDAEALQRDLESLPGVGGVHDLHLWSLGGESPVLTAHLVLDHSVSPERVLRRATAMIRERHGIRHTTLQVERPDFNIVESVLNDPV